MKSIRSSMLLKVLILAVGALGASVSSAHAQSANGRFTLPHEARWGNVLLSPGVYTFSLQSPSLPAAITVGKVGSTQIGVVLPEVVSAERLTAGSTCTMRCPKRRRQLRKRPNWVRSPTLKRASEGVRVIDAEADIPKSASAFPLVAFAAHPPRRWYWSVGVGPGTAPQFIGDDDSFGHLSHGFPRLPALPL